jgi:hypothetical protein
MVKIILVQIIVEEQYQGLKEEALFTHIQPPQLIKLEKVALRILLIIKVNNKTIIKLCLP